ncbi:GNAT family N-acetyltransferase [Acidiphilium sp. AL]|uniref:bifunctional helix-turn-helix transcriptional regulator/GNAT family N-acetyltransferase n=1 Tax=Acidiphilium sp. AL TaxID=2871704 RepID=UPI0021CB44BD|nr:bifunctional helix-turn-helix transcriptional regulator/GNAT family N-acetyltransferase [Acidiphilium sp. AL]MCU4159843.1 GNAT family N-acetyltransferase [Acidiphilium sp. AL]
MDAVAEVRSFNRFYTNRIGLLKTRLPESEFSLAEARVVFELAQGGEQTAAGIARRLDMDKAHLSRIVARFRTRGLLRSRVNPDHGKHHLLSLTDAGRAAFRTLDQGTRAQIGAMLDPLGGDARETLVAAMRRIRTVLNQEDGPADAAALRGLRPGDLGWIIHRQAVLYHRDYGWDWSYEGLVAEILGDFVKNFDAAREDSWIAAHAGGIAGSIFLVRSDDAAVAKLRLLYVEPEARGRGIGNMLVTACIDRAREFGYRRLALWTNNVLVSARRIYQAKGFRLVDETPHHSFGCDLVGQTWTLDL